MDLLTNSLFLLSLAILCGHYLGKISLARFNLGASGTLFAGMGLSWLIYDRFVAPYEIAVANGAIDVPSYAVRILQNGFVDKANFDFFLLLFVASVGLLAAKDVARVFRGNGAKFLLLAISITTTGAGVAYSLFRLIGKLDMHAITGLYAGALTSSPGLGAALESAACMFPDPASAAARAAQASVGMGYAIAYPFAAITVIICMQLLPKLFDVDLQQEVAQLDSDLANGHTWSASKPASFCVPGIAFVSLIGYILGSISIPLGSVGKVSLGTTGGVLVTGLILGDRGRLRMDERALNVTKQVALYYFLAYVGLNYGYQAATAMTGPNAMLVLVGILTTATSVLVGFLFGRYVLKMNWIILSGAICGSMTSTPGLGAAIDATGRNEAAGGYGATYPVGLLCKVVIVQVLSKLVW
ncbi:MAG: hypothetical protein WBL79_01350 [Bacillota bacterium]|nr:hypothetical protein [Bacillota bacterium]HOK70265.1 hypothetical protein [Bacillota bacterium]HOL51304.1 hypothetical protein [Bacillota bacterium]HPQ02087.1 hypothetical protein [Bacillota bacterium]HPZ14668.1 hypothetical protein [Bacillota bacterium]